MNLVKEPEIIQLTQTAYLIMQPDWVIRASGDHLVTDRHGVRQPKGKYVTIRPEHTGDIEIIAHTSGHVDIKPHPRHQMTFTSLPDRYLNQALRNVIASITWRQQR